MSQNASSTPSPEMLDLPPCERRDVHRMCAPKDRETRIAEERSRPTRYSAFRED